MTIQQLEYVLALEKYRHFVTAAEKCFVTQPTITLQLKKLEEEIGFLIFDRSSTPLKPTKSGLLIIDHARQITGKMKELKALVSESRKSIDGRFRMAVIPTIAPYLLPNFIGSFLEGYPETSIDIEEMRSEEIIEALKMDDIDIGILVTPTLENTLREIPLYNEAFLFYGELFPDRKSIQPNEVENLEGLWLLKSGHCFRNQVLNICSTNELQKKVNYKSGSIEMLTKLVDKYGGFTLIPELASIGVEGKMILPFEGITPIREVSLVVQKGFVKEELLNIIKKELLKNVPESFERNTRFRKIEWR